jgi:hypothetical protein
MRQERHGEIYREAFESASSELKEISVAFEQLRIRKDQIEKLVSVLGPLVSLKDSAIPEAQSAASAEPASKPAQSNPEAAGDQLVADPFQRRIDHVLGIGAGIRDVRKYTRQF